MQSANAPAPKPTATFSEAEELTPEIEALRAAVMEGHSLFVCGRAGVGKSRQLMWAKRHVEESRALSGRGGVVCLAPTGVAAVNVGGQTIHSFFRFGIGALNDGDGRRAGERAAPDRARIMRQMSLLIIDEVSMVRADLMNAVDQALRACRKRSDLPFGGVQVIMFGDVYQLPPIVKDEAEKRFIRDKFLTAMFFGAEAVKTMKRCELTRVFRQRERDYALALNDIRSGRLTPGAANVFRHRVGVRTGDAVTLTTTRAKAASINGEELRRLGNPMVQFPAELSGTAKPSDFMAPELLEICVGARVMTLVNHVDRLYSNGSVGTVLSIDSYHKEVCLKLDNSTDADHAIVTVAQSEFEKHEHVIDEETGAISKKAVGTMKQIPLQLAWACTIHKAQGLTLDRVHVDLQFGAFDAGQAYVALSRCRTLGGLTLERELWGKDMLQNPDADKYVDAMEPLILQPLDAYEDAEA